MDYAEHHCKCNWPHIVRRRWWLNDVLELYKNAGSQKYLELTNFCQVPRQKQAGCKEKGCSNNVKINTIRTLQSRGGIRNGICADASSISGGLTMNASLLLCYWTLWGEKWTSGRYPEASRYGISWPKKDIDLHELTLRTFLGSFPWGKGTLWLMWPRGLQRDGATPSSYKMTAEGQVCFLCPFKVQ